MSLNPKTKGYRLRVRRLAKQLHFAATYPWDDYARSFLTTLDRTDPHATPDMRMLAIEQALVLCKQYLQSSLDQAERMRIGLAKLQEFRREMDDSQWSSSDSGRTAIALLERITKSRRKP